MWGGVFQELASKERMGKESQFQELVGINVGQLTGQKSGQLSGQYQMYHSLETWNKKRVEQKKKKKKLLRTDSETLVINSGIRIIEDIKLSTTMIYGKDAVS